MNRRNSVTQAARQPQPEFRCEARTADIDGGHEESEGEEVMEELGWEGRERA